ncbi:unnamed protein product, partial [Rotaria sordida]
LSTTTSTKFPTELSTTTSTKFPTELSATTATKTPTNKSSKLLWIICSTTATSNNLYSTISTK